MICNLAYQSALLVQVSEEAISAGIVTLNSVEPSSHSPPAFVGWSKSGPFVMSVIVFPVGEIVFSRAGMSAVVCCGCDCTVDRRSRSRFPVAIKDRELTCLSNRWVGRQSKALFHLQGKHLAAIGSIPLEDVASNARKPGVGCVRVAIEMLGGSRMRSLYVGQTTKTLPRRQS